MPDNGGGIKANIQNIKEDLLEIKEGLSKGRENHTGMILAIQKNQDAIQCTQKSIKFHFKEHETWSNRVWGVIILAIGSFITSVISLLKKVGGT